VTTINVHEPASGDRRQNGPRTAVAASGFEAVFASERRIVSLRRRRVRCGRG
jgi:hypothetical protein